MNGGFDEKGPKKSHDIQQNPTAVNEKQDYKVRSTGREIAIGRIAGTAKRRLRAGLRSEDKLHLTDERSLAFDPSAFTTLLQAVEYIRDHGDEYLPVNVERCSAQATTKRRSELAQMGMQNPCSATADLA